MKLHDTDGVKFLTFEHFDKTGIVRHCFSTRIGGVSTGVYESMNLGFNRGDDKNNVLQNYHILGSKVGFDYKNAVLGSQCHLTNVYDVSEKDKGNGILFKNTLKEIDGLVTNIKNIVLTTFYADCVPLYFLDPIKRVIANSHSGWQGTAKNMAKSTIDEMIKLYNCEPKNILAGIGPSIGNCCFEVEKDVAHEFYKLPFSAHKYVTDKGDGKYYIDLWNVNKQLMLDCGIKEENIEMTTYCTKCNSDLFYSHRLSGADRGSMAAFIELI